VQDQGRRHPSAIHFEAGMSELRNADEVVAACLKETGAERYSKHAVQVANLALVLVPDGSISLRTYRKRIRQEYLRGKEFGSFFTLLVLPILISLISQWIAAWILRHSGTPIRTIRAQAFDAYTRG
jgi:hypothetical protein